MSTDAAQVYPVIIDHWDETGTIDVEVVLVDQFGVSKALALRAEEQRVSVVI